MSSTILRGAAATLACSALALGLGLVAPAAQAAPIPAPAGADPAPAASGAAYLAAQPGPNHIIKTWYVYPENTPAQSYDDYGLTIDAGYALDAVGGHPAQVGAITTALQAHIGDYVFGGSSAAKMAAYLLAQSRTGAAVDGVVATLEDHIATVAPNQGRLVDDDPYDYNTPLTQAYAVSALHDAGSPLAGSALSFALAQQCAPGFFRDAFSDKAAADQTCDGAASPTGSVDTTGLTVLMLQDQRSTPAVAASITKALDWLVSQQAANGSFNGGNTNSTGLAGWALGVGGRPAAAARAALWVRGQQLANAGTCTKYAAKDNGAITLDALGLANAATGPLSPVDNSVATRATTQALPALLWAPGGAAGGETRLTGPTDFVRAGSAQSVAVAGAPGDTLCVAAGGPATRLVLGPTGSATVPVTLPATTSTLTVSSIDAGGETDSVELRGLARTELRVKVKPRRLVRGAKAVVKVSGLEAGEPVTVKLGRREVTRQANARGKVKVRIRVARSGKVKAVGAFKERRGKAPVKVRP